MLTSRIVAGAARSILACPASASLVVEGQPNAIEEDLELIDSDGTPMLYCPPGSPVARAAAAHASALLTVTSGLGPRGGRERGDSITMAGRLEPTRGEPVVLNLNFVLLTRDDRQHRVHLQDFRSTSHRLNRGNLQRSTEHANECHQDELRRAVSHGAGVRPAELLGVQLAGLRPGSVEVEWVDLSGAHRRVVVFPHEAEDLAELGELLRHALHAGLCT